MYDGKDSDLTTALSNYFYFVDDARFGGWQAYLQRSDDFIRFCCYRSITEMLAARARRGSSIALGVLSLTRRTSMVTVATALFPVESVTRYVKASEVSSSPSWKYSNVPSRLNVKLELCCGDC